MKKGWKIFWVIIGIITAIVVVIVVANIIYDNSTTKDDGYNIAAEGLDVEFNADIIVYGENPKFRKTVKHRFVDEITEKTLSSDEEHGYRGIVLYDYNGTMEISDAELMLIMKYVEEKGYDMFYIGKNYLDDLQRLGFTVGYQEGACSLEYIGSINYGQEVPKTDMGNLYAAHGLWSDRDEEFKNREEIQNRIITLMYDYAREAAGIDF